MQRRHFLPIAALLASCKKQSSEKRYTLDGKVVGVNRNTQMAMIKGDKIEGWMEAMTMDYPVKDKSELTKLVVGDRITATVFVGESGYYIAGIKVVTRGGSLENH